MFGCASATKHILNFLDFSIQKFERKFEIDNMLLADVSQIAPEWTE